MPRLLERVLNLGGRSDRGRGSCGSKLRFIQERNQLFSTHVFPTQGSVLQGAVQGARNDNRRTGIRQRPVLKPPSADGSFIDGFEVCRHVALCLRQITRDTDLFARLGGEEFIALLPGTDMHGALVLAEKLRDAIEG